MPDRWYLVTFRSGRKLRVRADTVTDARADVQRTQSKQDRATTGPIDNVEREGGKVHPFGIGSPEYNRKHAVNPRTGMPRR